MTASCAGRMTLYCPYSPSARYESTGSRSRLPRFRPACARFRAPNWGQAAVFPAIARPADRAVPACAALAAPAAAPLRRTSAPAGQPPRPCAESPAAQTAAASGNPQGRTRRASAPPAPPDTARRCCTQSASPALRRTAAPALLSPSLLPPCRRAGRPSSTRATARCTSSTHHESWRGKGSPMDFPALRPGTVQSSGR